MYCLDITNSVTVVPMTLTSTSSASTSHLRAQTMRRNWGMDMKRFQNTDSRT